MRVQSINGPNLNLLGRREPEVYGSVSLDLLEEKIETWGRDLDIEVDHFQSNHEGAIVEAIHASDHDGIILNPGALTHTSRALGDAVASVSIPTVEVHISNVREREQWRRESVLSGVAAYSIYGRGLIGYRDALRHLRNREAMEFSTLRYGPHPDNVGDLRRGDGRLVILVHGGFWRHEWTRDTMESLAVDLTRRGNTTWNIEYRRLGTGGGWPGSAHDVLTALEFTPQIGSGSEDVTVIGHSAGGHLALWAGMKTAEVTRVIGLAPVTDLATHATSDLYGAEEAQRLLDRGASSALDGGPTRAILFHGTEDELVPAHHSSRFSETGDTELVSVDADHFELLDPSHPYWDRVVDAIESS